VGNIAAGGTGKTPLVAALARTFLEAGARPAILTRGYRRRERTPVLAWRDPDISWERVGDEPALLARELPEVPIIADADRVRGAQRAVSETGATHLILDDGFQHWRLARDLDLVAVDTRDPLGRRVVRREGPSALRRAHAVLLTGAWPEGVRSAAEEIRRIAPGARLMATTISPRAVHVGGESYPWTWLRGRRVFAVAGIAAPERFFGLLQAIGAELVTVLPLGDHHTYTRRELELLVRDARQRQALPIVTAKDAVKFPPDLSGGVAWLGIEAVPLEGSFRELLSPLLAQQGAPAGSG
jgi:tetraacyldisaccharide 4'-kinase